MGDDVAHSRFVINNWDDIATYVIQSDEFDLIEAATMHLISLQIERRTDELRRRKAQREKKPVAEIQLTEEEINQYIYNAFDVDIIDRYKVDAG